MTSINRCRFCGEEVNSSQIVLCSICVIRLGCFTQPELKEMRDKLIEMERPERARMVSKFIEEEPRECRKPERFRRSYDRKRSRRFSRM